MRVSDLHEEVKKWSYPAVGATILASILQLIAALMSHRSKYPVA